MKKPSIFSKDYEKIMRKRKRKKVTSPQENAGSYVDTPKDKVYLKAVAECGNMKTGAS